MKVFLSLIGVLVVILIGIGVVAVQSQPINVYEEATHVSGTEVYNDVEGVNYYYYYSETCSHCANIKDDIADFYEYTESNEDVDLYLIDTDINTGLIDSDYAQLTSEEDMIDYLNTIDDPVIAGTPTLIETTDGEITGVKVGETQIPEYIDSEY